MTTGPRPLISCCCSTHGRPYFVEEAIGSFVRQVAVVLPSCEMLVLNDCPEQTLHCDVPGVRVVNLPAPIPDAASKFNAAVSECRGEWVAWWEDDDISMPWRLGYSLVRVRVSGKPYWKQDAAFCWHHGQICEWSRKSLFFGNAIFKRKHYLDTGGAIPGEWADQTAHDAMAANDNLEQETPRKDDTFFVYRWGGMGWHDSGHPGPAAERFAVFREKTLADPRFVPGDINLEAKWHADYTAQVTRWMEAHA